MNSFFMKLVQVILQNDPVCLPPGLDCYRKEVKLSQKDCSVLPCKGIYADVVKYDTEDLLLDKHVLDKYRQYKAGFNFDKGEQITTRQKF